MHAKFCWGNLLESSHQENQDIDNIKMDCSEKDYADESVGTCSVMNEVFVMDLQHMRDPQFELPLATLLLAPQLLIFIFPVKSSLSVLAF